MKSDPVAHEHHGHSGPCRHRDGWQRPLGEKKNRPRTFGHQAGLKALRKIVEHCGNIGVKELTVFAFSSENWNRPEKEVSRLMDLFMRALDREAKELHENEVRIRFIGDLTAFSPEMQQKMDKAMSQTAGNQRMTLNVAANYGGRWDIVNAARKTAKAFASGEHHARTDR